MKKHTPGPWHNEYFDRVDGGGTSIAWLNKGNQAECAANARLMAAAPELLLALERVLHNYVDANDADDPEIVEAYAAIRKAKGE